MIKQYSPPTRAYPQELPDRWRFADGTVRTDLKSLSDEELNNIGWTGPIQMPPFEGTSHFTHNYNWNSETLSFDVEELSEDQKKSKVNYAKFWNFLSSGIAFTLNGEENGPIVHKGIAYKKIKDLAKQSLEVNTSLTEFMYLLSDAKMGNADVEKIQEGLSEIINLIPFSPEEFLEIEIAFLESGMFAIYTLS